MSARPGNANAVNASAGIKSAGRTNAAKESVRNVNAGNANRLEEMKNGANRNAGTENAETASVGNVNRNAVTLRTGNAPDIITNARGSMTNTSSAKRNAEPKRH